MPKLMHLAFGLGAGHLDLGLRHTDERRLSLVLKSGCQFAHETARGVTAARHENAVKLAGGLQVGANDLCKRPR